MKLKHAIYFCAIILFTNACLKEGDPEVSKINYTNYFYNTEVTLNSDMAPVLLVRTDTNGVTQNRWEFTYSDTTAHMRVYNSNNITQQIKVFKLNEYGKVETSFDTLFTDNGYILITNAYVYEDSASIPLRKELHRATFENGVETSATNYNIIYNLTEDNGLQEQSVDIYYRSCSNFYYFNDTISLKFDVLSPISFLENLKNEFVTENIVFNVGCSTGQAAENKYEYHLNENGYVDKMVVSSYPEFFGQSEINANRIRIDYTYNFIE